MFQQKLNLLIDEQQTAQIKHMHHQSNVKKKQSQHNEIVIAMDQHRGPNIFVNFRGRLQQILMNDGFINLGTTQIYLPQITREKDSPFESAFLCLHPRPRYKWSQSLVCSDSSAAPQPCPHWLAVGCSPPHGRLLGPETELQPSQF